MPEWADVVKTGSSRERPPTQDDWWHTRGAAILRKIARQGPIGVTASHRIRWTKEQRLQTKHPGVGSRKVIRILVQQLEDAGLVATDVGRLVEPEGRESTQLYNGRVITSAGQNSSMMLHTVSAQKSKQHTWS